MENETDNVKNRRELASRKQPWAHYIMHMLVRSGVSANTISFISMPIAALGAWSLYAWPAPYGLLVCAACIQLRLLCNLLDGLVAVEGKRASATGALWNEIPDRVADSLLLIALGYATSQAWLGWLAALLAMMTAYIRCFGGALNLKQDFVGPMAKQHRMFAMTIGCLLALLTPWLGWAKHALEFAAWIIVIGSVITCIVRIHRIAKQLHTNPKS